MGKKQVSHKKISGNHTTLIEAAIPIMKKVVQLPEVRRVTPGFIQAGLRTLRKFPASVKIRQDKGYIRLVIRSKTSVQEIHIYTADSVSTAATIAEQSQQQGYRVQEDKNFK